MLAILSLVRKKKISIALFDRDHRYYRYYAFQRNNVITFTEARLAPRLPLAAIRLSHLHIMLTFSSVLVYDAEAARLLSANSSLRARLCASQFSRIRSGTLKADNRMRNINHSIHLISAIIYTARSLADQQRARLNDRNRMRWSNKIFTISNKLPGIANAEYK